MWWYKFQFEDIVNKEIARIFILKNMDADRYIFDYKKIENIF